MSGSGAKKVRIAKIGNTDDESMNLQTDEQESEKLSMKR
jgi:hypothetical protein